ncbi:uncharacterized protein LOC141856219 [Brevipalpus obovatus]|uniref:uncharacterized protein LOC141856219 n=1 Tax=Brevipalpus obovatus TaxID=246614 RepID=UPI003D9F25B8
MSRESCELNVNQFNFDPSHRVDCELLPPNIGKIDNFTRSPKVRSDSDHRTYRRTINKIGLPLSVQNFLTLIRNHLREHFWTRLMDIKVASDLPDDEQFISLCKRCDILALKKLRSLTTLDANIVNARDENGLSGLAHLCIKGRNDCIKIISEFNNLDANIRDNEGNTPLILATQSGHCQVLTCLVSNFRKQINLDARNDFGFTALMKGAILGRTKCIQILLRAGSNPNLRDPSRGFTALQWAQYCSRTTCVEEMIKFLDEEDHLLGCCKPIGHDIRQPSASSGHHHHHHHHHHDSSLLAQVATSSTLCASSPVLPSISSMVASGTSDKSSSPPSQLSPSTKSQLVKPLTTSNSDGHKSLIIPQIVITQPPPPSSSSSGPNSSTKMASE